MKKSPLFFFLLIISVFTCSQIVAQTPANLKLFNNKEYSVSYPQEWTIDTSKMMGIDLFIFSPLEANDKFRENINIIKSDLNGEKITLDSLVQVSVKQIEAMATEYVLIRSKQVHEHGITFHLLEFTATQGIFHLHFLQYYFLTETKVYTITLTAEANNYSMYKEKGEQIMNSFTIKQ